MSDPEFNEPAYPCADIHFGGMTIRQAFVMAAMQGLLAHKHQGYTNVPSQLAYEALRNADAVLKAERETR